MIPLFIGLTVAGASYILLDKSNTKEVKNGTTESTISASKGAGLGTENGNGRNAGERGASSDHGSGGSDSITGSDTIQSGSESGEGGIIA